MSKIVVLSLGFGSFRTGFPAVTARLGEVGNLYMQFTGNLPTAPDIPQLLRDWRLMYTALYQSDGFRGIEIVESGITHCSEGNFNDICQQLQTRLNTWFKSDGFRKIESQLRTQLNPSESVRVIIESNEPEVWKLPWHLWDFLAEYRQAELAFSTPDYPPPAYQVPPQHRKAQVKILAILGNSAGINLEKDRELLQRLPGVDIKWLVEPERQELNDQLWQAGWDIIFFAGHSQSAETLTHGRLYINQNAQNNSITIGELKEALSQAVYNGLKLAIFNSCDGLGLARDLAAAQIPLPPMIVMREPVADQVAQAFLKYFLKNFSAGEPFHLSVRQAREQLRGVEHDFPGASWLPVICQHPAVTPPTWKPLVLPERQRDTIPFIGLSKWVAIVLVAAISSYLSFGSQLAILANKMGLKNHQNGQLLIAKRYYNIATVLNPNYAQPHYNLGWICNENLDDKDCAEQRFKQAALRGLPDAYPELARLQLQQHNLESALKQTWDCLKHSDYDEVKAACLKNRGWVRWEQQRLEEAEADLRRAIALQPDSPHAYCLLAQVLETKGNHQDAVLAWENTLRYSDYNVPEQDECIALARENLVSSRTKLNLTVEIREQGTGNREQ
ncbi:MAG: tetratricopeptide repeat protein [Coleofasciculus sp. D1-CHI-01]|uniref:CHAT domain-containing tetratricopeptide repeat protein n=1 Tax=Coleofasciculus sp. D1-CHI-01 TaxID=3068482 RepID=UPI0032FAAB11